ncbi:lipoprotein [Thalassotalea ponticola]|uniref:LPS translocon maturation chaperone LptM n=1 Tax=Thalassotalea ponticola TaxID=1523392 RepID=UPI0025B58542|nr:lipoprotein [Thalassotalea ponticola]MDN3652777.1 lipoprotein [Thalassotalea ponticola]
MVNKLRLLPWFCVALSLLAACGQKGPLYEAAPTDTNEQSKSAVEAPNEAGQANPNNTGKR